MGLGLAGPAPAAADTYNGYETPSYTVERRIGEAEIRSYGPYILAEVTIRGDQDDALGRGFGILAGYIFGGNVAGGQVAMTTPVAQRPAEGVSGAMAEDQATGDQDWTVSFSMPAAYTLDSLPAARNDAIRLTEAPADRQIALRFSGRTTRAALDAKAAELRAVARAENLRIVAGPFFYFYDDPFTLPWNRRNEVAFRIE